MSGVMSVVRSFPETKSLFESGYSCLKEPLKQGEKGVFLLDLDHTLIEAKSTLGGEHFYQFLKKCNKERGFSGDGHYSWTVAIREKISYRTCEPVDKINQLLSDLRKNGWNVKILTSRGLDMKEITASHLKDSGLDFSIEDVILKDRRADGTKKLLKKDESFMNWIGNQSDLQLCEKVRIVFYDDSTEYCKDVAKVADWVNKATVECFHYIGSLPDPKLSETQLKNLAVELHAYAEGRQIVYDYSESDLKNAMKYLNIDAISKESLYSATAAIAKKDGLPFA